MTLVVKDPDAQIDYAIDWGEDYLDGQHIVASQWFVSPSEIGGMSVPAISHNLLRTAARVDGGRTGQVYQLCNRVTLSDGQVDERTIAIRVEAR